MKISDLELFCAVAEERSFVKATRRLYISQSAVTQHIKKIEAELGFPLLARDKHFVALTPQGEIFLRSSEEIVQSYRQALADCTRATETEQKLTVYYIGASSFTFLPEVLKEFHELYPDCEIVTKQIRPGNETEAFEKGETNLIYTPYELVADDPKLNFYPLFLDIHYCVMNAEDPCAEKKQLCYEDLAGKTVLLPNRAFRTKHGDNPEANSLRHLEPVISRLMQPELGCRLENGRNPDNVMMQLLSRSGCYAIMPGHAVPAHPKLRAVPFRSGVTISVGLAYAKPMNRLELAFADMARFHG